MGFLDDLNKSVGMFDGAMQQYKTSQAFAKASEQINEANTNLVKELDKRQAVQSAAQTLAQDLLQAGAPVSRIQAAFSAFSPQPLPSAEQQIAEGAQFNDLTLIKQGQKQQRAQAQTGVNLTEEKAQRDHLRQLELLGLKQNTSAKTKDKLPIPILKKIDEFDTAETQLNDLVARLDKDPDLTAPISSKDPTGITSGARAILNPKFGAFRADTGRFFDVYKKLISGVAVGEKEMEDLRQNVPNVNDTNKVYKAKAANFTRIMKKVKKKYLQNVEKGGYNVSNFKEQTKQTETAPITGGGATGSFAIPGLKGF